MKEKELETVNELGLEEVKELGKNYRNRSINRGHVNGIKRGMRKSFDLFPVIVVNRSTNHIIDGQHRVQAFIELVEKGVLSADRKMKAMYIDIPEEEELETIVNLNNNVMRRTFDDYIDVYVEDGDENYEKLKQFAACCELAQDRGKVKYVIAAAIVTGKDCTRELGDGEFKATEEEYDRASEVAAEMEYILGVFGSVRKGGIVKHLALKWIEVRGLHTFTEWKEAFEMTAADSEAPKPGMGSVSDWEKVFAWASLKVQMMNR